MRKANWIAGSAIVFVVLAIALTFDPLGFFDGGADDTERAALEDNRLTSTGLKTRGERALPDADPTTWEGEPVGRLVLKLGTATLKGKVTGAGEPLRFARVRPVLPPPHDRVAVRTTKDGAYEISGLPAGQHELRAAAEDFRSRTAIAPMVPENGSADVETVDLERRADVRNAIRVKVTDAFGRPLPGAKVLATTMPWDLHMAMGPKVSGVPSVNHKSGVTDDMGVIQLGPLPPEKYAVVATADGYVASFVNDLVVSNDRTRAVGLRMIEGVSVRGRVVDHDGAGVSGALVMGMAQPSWASSESVLSAADGTFTLTGLRKSGYIFMGWHEDLGQTMSQGASPGTITLKLEGTGRVKGKVVWEDGTPVTDGIVRPFQNGPFQYVYSMVSDLEADGTFELSLPKGTWILRVQSSDGHMSDATSATVTVGATEEVEIKLPKTGVARGVVMDEDGNHIAGAELFVMKGGFPETPSREQYSRTDADGRFEVPGLPAETIGLYVQHAEYQDQKLEVTAGEKELSVRLKRGASVVGRVTDASGNAIAGEQVNLVQGWFDVRSTHTDAEGRFRIDAVTPGTYAATTGPYEQNARGLRKDGIKVGDEGEVPVEFVVPAAAGKLTGSVMMGGKPVAGAKVTVIDGRGDEQAVGVVTDEKGAFLAEGLQFGPARVSATTSAGQRGSARTNIAEDGSGTVAIEIGTATVSVRVLDADGEAISGSWINVELADPETTGWGRVKANGNSNSEGRYTSRGLQPATYILRVNRLEFAQYVSQPFTLADGENKDLGDVRMRRGAVLQGVVRNDAGGPIEKVTVSLRDMQGREVFLFSMATSGSDGRYAMHSVEPGRYQAHFQVKGHATADQTVEITAEGGTADAVLTRGGSVAVRVQDQGGKPVEDARIRLFDAKGQEVTRTISLANFDSGRRFTNADGATSLADLTSGTYTVKCEKAGYVVVGSDPRARIEPGATAAVKIVLEPAP